jgi:hypothetical protein
VAVICVVMVIISLLVATSGCSVSETTKNESSGGSGNAGVDVIINSKSFSPSTKTGYQHLIFDVTVKNLNEKDLSIGNPNYFKLTTADGSVYEYSYLSTLSNAISSVSHTNPGEKVTGAIAFEIPRTAQPTKLQYNDYSNQVLINLTTDTSATVDSSVPIISNEKTVGNKTIFTSSRAYQISYPQTLKTDISRDAPSPVELYIYLKPDETVDSVLVVSKSLTSGQTFSVFADNEVKALKDASSTGLYKNFAILNETSSTFAGKPAHTIVWSGIVPQQYSKTTATNTSVNEMQTYVVNNNTGYVITYKAISSDYDTYLAQAQQIIDSFKFI